jgi:hypothetical protein
VDAEASSHAASSLFPSRTENRMTPVDHLAEAWLRHKWADQAGEAFQRSCVEFTSTDPYLVYAQWEAESWEVSFRGPRDPTQEAENSRNYRAYWGLSSTTPTRPSTTPPIK